MLRRVESFLVYEFICPRIDALHLICQIDGFGAFVDNGCVHNGQIPVGKYVGGRGLFGALARKWATPIIFNYPYTGARLFAKAGKITGSIGLGLGIGFTVFWALYCVLLLVLTVIAAA